MPILHKYDFLKHLNRQQAATSAIDLEKKLAIFNSLKNTKSYIEDKYKSVDYKFGDNYAYDLLRSAENCYNNNFLGGVMGWGQRLV